MLRWRRARIGSSTFPSNMFPEIRKVVAKIPKGKWRPTARSPKPRDFGKRPARRVGTQRNRWTAAVASCLGAGGKILLPREREPSSESGWRPKALYFAEERSGWKSTSSDSGFRNGGGK